MEEGKIRIKYSKQSIRTRTDNKNHSFIIQNLSTQLILFSYKKMAIMILGPNLFIVKILSEGKTCKMYHLTIFKEGYLSLCLIICTKTHRIQYQSTSLMSLLSRLKVGPQPLICPLLQSQKPK
jgi:hypothetical protein